ncbi:MAG: helix-turn-helix transcriptional regulator [Clostridia bacterium]|nr:helix-turn-helix transcriptional regulator [Clostridia bacterium]
MENKFAERLFELRQERHLSQESVAKAVGVSQKSIDFWEKGVNEPKLSYIVKLAIFFNVSCDFLTGLKDE